MKSLFLVFLGTIVFSSLAQTTNHTCDLSPAMEIAKDIVRDTWDINFYWFRDKYKLKLANESRNRNMKLLKELADSGGDLNAQDCLGRSVFHHLLSDGGKRIGTSNHMKYVDPEMMDLIGYLVQKGANINLKTNSSKITVLFYLMKYYHNERALIDSLIKNSADINTVNRKGHSVFTEWFLAPTHWRFDRTRAMGKTKFDYTTEMIKYILGLGANPCINNKFIEKKLTEEIINTRGERRRYGYARGWFIRQLRKRRRYLRNLVYQYNCM